MKILRIADVPDNRTGGASRCLKFVGDLLSHDGHKVDYLFQDKIGLRWLDYRVRRLLVPLRVVQFIRDEAIRGNRYDIVEIHEPSAAAYCIARRLDRILPPVIVSSHGVESRCHRAMLEYLIGKGERVSLKQRFAYRMTTLWQSNFALRHADQVVLCTTEDRNYLESTLSIPPHKVTFLNGGVSQAFLECPTGPSPGRGVLFLASWVPRKGIMDLVPALIRLVRERPGTPITIAGCGLAADQVLADFPEEFRSAIRVISHIQGELSLLDEYRRHAIFLAPSIFEGQLLTMLEAAAAGLAVVATATCGMKDFVDDGVNGLLCPIGDPEVLFTSILRLIDNPGFTNKLGERAQATARCYTWRRAADQFMNAIREALANASSDPR